MTDHDALAALTTDLGKISSTATAAQTRDAVRRAGKRAAALLDVVPTTPPPTTPPPTTPPPTAPKFYTAGSTWNTPVPVGAQYFDRPELRSASWWVNADDYGTPTVRSAASDPVVTIQAPASWGWPAQTLTLRIPAGVTGAAGTDGSLTVIDGTTAYDFWQFRRSGNTATVAAWAKNDIVSGDGWGTKTPFLAAGIHATGSALTAGLIVGNELTQGINHALALALRFDLASSQAVGQAIHSDGQGGSGAIPEGSRLAIPPGVTMPSSVQSPQGKNLWRAAQQYGCFVIDVMGGGTVGAFCCASPASNAGLAVPSSDVQTLLAPSWTAVEATAVGAALKIAK